MIQVIWAAARFQMLQMRRSLDDLMGLVTLPLFALAFLAILVEAGRLDLAPYAILGTALMAVWTIALFVSGEIIETERATGTLEATVATPASLAALVTGRIATVTLVSLLGLVESVLVAWLVFGITVEIHHPAVFLLTLLCTVVAVAGTATVMAGAFVLTRSARTFQNSLSYPFFVLGGVLVPVVFLPGWLQPISQLVFLSWSADLLRDSLLPGEVSQVPLRLGIILALGMLAFGIGFLLISRVLRRIRQLGQVSYV